MLATAGAMIFSFSIGQALVNPAIARDAPPGFADLVDKLSPAVVNIATTRTTGKNNKRPPRNQPGGSLEDMWKDFLDRQGGPRRLSALGSGFIIDAAGYVVTNNHVIGDADDISVTLQDDTTFKATLVGKDAKTDLALLKLNLGNHKAPLPTVKFGDSEKTRVGDWVMAIGNPFGLGGTVTVGIISARSRSLQGPYDDFLQTDAAINQGNSGGPMFNMDGDVVGINTAIISPGGERGGSVGIGFAIPSNMAKLVVDQLREFGHTKRGWLGVRIQTIDEDMAKNLQLDRPHGALIAEVTPGGPADKAGIKSKDVVLTFDGKDISESRKLSRVVADTRVGIEVAVVVWREGQRKALKVKVGELDESDQKLAANDPDKDNPLDPDKPNRGKDMSSVIDTFGFTLAPITAELRDRYDIPKTTKGVVVTKVMDGGLAAEKAIRPGDVVVDINQNQIATPDDFVQRVKEARDSKRKSVLLLIDRQGDLRFVALRIDG
ncbi:MAG: DegQ family serine endoprotease [Rhodospirillales bacterium]